MKPLETLAKELYTAKQREKAEKSERVAIEEQIAKMVDTGENGSKTVDAGSGLKVVVKRSLGYKADLNAIIHIDGGMVAIKKTEKDELNAKVYDALRTDDPVLFNKISQFVVTTPRKVSVSLKLS